MLNKQPILTARQLYDRGYRGVSNRFRIAARVDQDIQKFVGRDVAKMRQQHNHRNWSQYNFLLQLPRDRAEDWFRRCISKDTLTLTPIVYRQLKQLETR